MEQNRKKRIEKSLEIIARKEGTTTEKVREEIALAISCALKSSDKDIQHFWQDIPCEGDSPTVEEIIGFLAEKIAEK